MKQSAKEQLLREILMTPGCHQAEISGPHLYRWMRANRLPNALDKAFDNAQADAHTELDQQFIIIKVTP